jgi:CRISPR-associated protein Cas6
MKNTIELAFKLKGAVIPADHGYLLFSALTRAIETIHSISNIGIHSISGEPIDNRLLKLNDRSRLTFRLDSEEINLLLPLIGKYLDLGGHEIMIGTPQTYLLKPAARLYSRLVVIKGYMEPNLFLEAAVRQLEVMDISGKPCLVPLAEAGEKKADGKGTRSPYLRRTIRISGVEVVGFALKVSELTAEESIALMEKGIGGRRHFGCGIFIPDRR